MQALGVITNQPAAEYHAQREFIGSSTITIMDDSARHFYHAWTGPKTEPSPQMIKGTLIHDLLLEQNVNHYVARPVNEKGDLVRSNSKEYADFLAANPGKTPIHPDDFNELSAMLDSFVENQRAMAMLKDAKIEYSVFTKDPETGLSIKARPDIWGNGYLVDLKSTTDIRKFENQIFRDMYDVRLIHYAKCIEFQTGEKIKDIYFIAYEQSAPYCSKIFKLRPSDVEKAEAKWRILMNQISVCQKSNIWPGYSDDVTLVTRPRFFEEEVITFDEVV